MIQRRARSTERGPGAIQFAILLGALGLGAILTFASLVGRMP